MFTQRTGRFAGPSARRGRGRGTARRGATARRGKAPNFAISARLSGRAPPTLNPSIGVSSGRRGGIGSSRRGGPIVSGRRGGMSSRNNGHIVHSSARRGNCSGAGDAHRQRTQGCPSAAAQGMPSAAGAGGCPSAGRRECLMAAGAGECPRQRAQGDAHRQRAQGDAHRRTQGDAHCSGFTGFKPLHQRKSTCATKNLVQGEVVVVT